MRAEMTVGFEIESLENLRIYNGYGEVKRERKVCSKYLWFYFFSVYRRYFENL